MQTAKVINLGDYTQAPPPPQAAPQPVPQPVARREPYSNEEISAIAGQLSSIGIDPELAEEFLLKYQGRVTPILQVLETGEALADMGISKGTGVSRAPSWLRCLAAGVGLGFVTFTLRNEYGSGSSSSVDSVISQQPEQEADNYADYSTAQPEPS